MTPLGSGPDPSRDPPQPRAGPPGPLSPGPQPWGAPLQPQPEPLGPQDPSAAAQTPRTHRDPSAQAPWNPPRALSPSLDFWDTPPAWTPGTPLSPILDPWDPLGSPSTLSQTPSGPPATHGLPRPQRPSLREGSTPIIADDRGHLLPTVRRSQVSQTQGHPAPELPGPPRPSPGPAPLPLFLPGLPVGHVRGDVGDAAEDPPGPAGPHLPLGHRHRAAPGRGPQTHHPDPRLQRPPDPRHREGRCPPLPRALGMAPSDGPSSRGRNRRGPGPAAVGRCPTSGCWGSPPSPLALGMGLPRLHPRAVPGRSCQAAALLPVETIPEGAVEGPRSPQHPFSTPCFSPGDLVPSALKPPCFSCHPRLHLCTPRVAPTSLLQPQEPRSAPQTAPEPSGRSSSAPDGATGSPPAPTQPAPREASPQPTGEEEES